MKLSYLLLLMVIPFISCNSQKETTVVDIPEEEKAITYFDIGQGGGFSGHYIEYRVYSDGKIKKFDFATESHFPWSYMTKEDAERFFQQIEELDLFELEINMPDNMSDYLIIYSEDARNKLVWPFGGKGVNSEIYTLFKEVFELSNKKSKNSTSVE